jgi:hypothetical protein
MWPLGHIQDIFEVLLLIVIQLLSASLFAPPDLLSQREPDNHNA